MRGVWVVVASAVLVLPVVPATPGPEPVVDVVLWIDEDARASVTSVVFSLGLAGARTVHLSALRVVGPESAVARVAAMAGVVSAAANAGLDLYSASTNEAIGVPRAWASGATGEGAVVMTIDTGVDGAHPDLIYGVDVIGTGAAVDAFERDLPVAWTPTAGPTSDWHGHGTHVAGIAAGSGRGGAPGLDGVYPGVAPDAKIVAFSFLGTAPADRATVWGALAGFDYALSMRDALSIDVISNSWGLAGAFRPDHPINLASKRAYEAGMTVVFAAGNDAFIMGPRSLNQFCVAPWVLCVGATDNARALAEFSSRGIDPVLSGDAWDHPDLVAPGVGVRAPRTTTEAGSFSSGTNPSYMDEIVAGGVPAADALRYATRSGTSMAAPHVAGVAALVIGANPHLSPDQVHRILVKSADAIPGGAAADVGAGFLDAAEAVQLARHAKGQIHRFLHGHRSYDGGADDPALARDAFADVTRQRVPPLLEARDAGTGADAPDDGATPLAISDGLHLGEVASATDVDRYAIAGEPGERLEVTLKPLDGDLNLEVLGLDGRVVASSAAGVHVPDEVAVAGASYVVRVFAASNPSPLLQPSAPAPPNAGRYTLAIARAIEPEQNDAGTGGDVGGTVAEAHPVGAGEFTGVLSPIDTDDAYALDVPARTHVTITLTAPPGTHFDLRLRWLAAPGLVTFQYGGDAIEEGTQSFAFVTNGPESWVFVAHATEGAGTYGVSVVVRPAGPGEVDAHLR